MKSVRADPALASGPLNELSPQRASGRDGRSRASRMCKRPLRTPGSFSASREGRYHESG